MRFTSLLLTLQSIMNWNQRGFALPELLIVMAITGIIGGVTVTSIIQTNDTVIRDRNHMTTVHQVQNAGYWIQVDTKTAQTVEVDPGDTGLPVELTWVDWDNTTHEVTYDVANSQLLRHYSVNGSTASTMAVAASVVTGSPSTTCRFIDVDDNPDGEADVLVFTVTTVKGSGRYEKTETRVFKFEPRSG